MCTKLVQWIVYWLLHVQGLRHAHASTVSLCKSICWLVFACAHMCKRQQIFALGTHDLAWTDWPWSPDDSSLACWACSVQDSDWLLTKGRKQVGTCVGRAGAIDEVKDWGWWCCWWAVAWGWEFSAEDRRWEQRPCEVQGRWIKVVVGLKKEDEVKGMKTRASCCWVFLLGVWGGERRRRRKGTWWVVNLSQGIRREEKGKGSGGVHKGEEKKEEGNWWCTWVKLGR